MKEKDTEGIKIVYSKNMGIGRYRYSAYMDKLKKKPVVVKECNKLDEIVVDTEPVSFDELRIIK